MLKPDDLRSFCQNFYGYGEQSAPHWFISMEEGGGTSEPEIQMRLDAWISRGRRELEDAGEYHDAIHLGKWFASHPPIQRTWSASIRMLLIFGGVQPTTERVREYQRTTLGRKGGVSRLSPLFPLPAKSIDHWHYGEWTDDNDFSNRRSYRKFLERVRTRHLSEQIRQFAPRTVVFYGQSYMEYWHAIAGLQFTHISDGFAIAKNVGTRFVICKHPAVQGITNEYFETIGRRLAAA